MLPRKAVFRSIAGIVLVVMTLVALSNVLVTSEAFAQTKPLQKVRINKIPIADFVPADLTMSQAWFKDEGLDVVIETVAGGAVAMQALVAGKLDIMYGSFDNSLKARAQGFDVMILLNMVSAPLKPPSASAILVRKDIGIQSLKDLEGKRVLVSSLQNVGWAYTREAVLRDGGDPSKVHFLELNFPQMVDALLGGQADAANTSEPFTAIGLATGKLSAISYLLTELQPGLNIAR